MSFHIHCSIMRRIEIPLSGCTYFTAFHSHCSIMKRIKLTQFLCSFSTRHVCRDTSHTKPLLLSLPFHYSTLALSSLLTTHSQLPFITSRYRNFFILSSLLHHTRSRHPPSVSTSIQGCSQHVSQLRSDLHSHSPPGVSAVSMLNVVE